MNQSVLRPADSDSEKPVPVLHELRKRGAASAGFGPRGGDLKRQHVTSQNGDEDNGGNEVSLDSSDIDDRSLDDLAIVCSHVSPLATFSYPSQVSIKRKHALRIAKKATKQVYKHSLQTTSTSARWCNPQVARRFVGFPVEDVVEAPPGHRVAYRNKCEFTIGYRSPPTEAPKYDVPIDPSTIDVGFVVGRKGDELVVGKAWGSVVVPSSLCEVCYAMKSMIIASGIPVHSKHYDQGVWRLMLLRISSDGRKICMALSINHNTPPDVRTRLIDLILEKIVGASKDGAGELTTSRKKYSGATIESLYIHDRKDSSNALEGPVDHIWGESMVEMEILGAKFQVLPTAFFQVNIPMCEELYRRAIDAVAASKPDVVVDVCCGTGTLGILCAKLLGKSVDIYGIEMQKSAIESAKYNAVLNDESRVDFREGRVEDLLEALLKEVRSRRPDARISVVVDPPRGGLVRKVCETLRDTAAIGQVVYISCNGESLADNLTTLCTPVLSCGTPFRPRSMVPVDMFPHTYHLEFLAVLDRLDPEEDAALPTAPLLFNL